MQQLKKLIAVCAHYAVKKGLCFEQDLDYVHNRLLAIFGIDAPYDLPVEVPDNIADTLGQICDLAAQMGLLEQNNTTFRELFDNKVAGCMLMPPSQVSAIFSQKERTEGIKAATDWFYALCRDSNYIRTREIARNMQWTAPSPYGDVEITVNLTKPEKDPKEIELALKAPKSAYPACQLCVTNVGYAGRVNHPSRTLLRTIPLTLNHEQWHMQYSPYVYFNEHCIALSQAHTPMEISRATYLRLFDFQDRFPHYFIGSNAGLPIAGGSILGHLHFQGGRYSLPMMRAAIRTEYPSLLKNAELCVLDWPMPAIRLCGKDRNALIDAADAITTAWEGYSDPSLGIYATTNGENHNTITPILHLDNGVYNLDLVLRNNITSPERPLGVFHPHPMRHHIKKENIGLIEVMGLFILPGRLKSELFEHTASYLAGAPYDADKVASHKQWADELAAKYTVSTPEDARNAIKTELGTLCMQLLGDAGVFKDDEQGRAGLDRFIKTVFN